MSSRRRRGLQAAAATQGTNRHATAERKIRCAEFPLMASRSEHEKRVRLAAQTPARRPGYNAGRGQWGGLRRFSERSKAIPYFSRMRGPAWRAASTLRIITKP